MSETMSGYIACHGENHSKKAFFLGNLGWAVFKSHPPVIPGNHGLVGDLPISGKGHVFVTLGYTYYIHTQGILHKACI